MAGTTLSDRALLRLSGEDVGGFLQGLVTQDTALLAPGRPLWAGLLTAQGKVLFDFILWDDGEDVLIDCEAGAADALIRRLTVYRLRRPIEIELDEELAVHWSASSEALDHGPAHDPRLPDLGYRWIAPAGDEDASADWRAHRLALGVAEGIAELGSDKTLWLECNAEELNGVDFKKGCYVGQENTARMHYRKKVKRRLVVVPLDRADEKRRRAAYPALGLAIEHRRVEDMSGLDLPDWQRVAIG